MTDGKISSEVELANLRALFDGAPAAAGVLSAEFRYLYVNRALARRHGLSPEDHVGRSVADVVPSLWREIEPLLARVLAGETVTDAHFTAAGSAEERAGHWLSTYYPLRDGDRVAAIGVLIHDVTAQREAEAALEVKTRMYSMLAGATRAAGICATREELFRTVCEIAVADGGFRLAWVAVPHFDGVRVVASTGEATDYLDYIGAAETAISLDPGDPRSRGPMGQAFIRGVRAIENDIASSSAMQPWRDAAARAGLRSSAGFPVREGGRVVAVLSLHAGEKGFFTPELVETIGEVTPTLSAALDRLALDRERSANEAALRLRDRALDATTEGIVITDATAFDNPIVYVNTGFVQMTGYGREQLMGRNCRLLQGPDSPRQALDDLRLHITAGESCTAEVLNYRRDGTRFWSRLAISPIFGKSGAVTHFVGVITLLDPAAG